MVLRVNGGVITDQMLTGGLRFFKLSSAALDHYANTISDGGVVIPGAAQGGRTVGGGEAALFQTIAVQDETDYAVFAGGTQYDAGDIITMSDGTIVLVDLEAANVVTQFTILGASKTGFTTATVLTQVSSTGDGDGGNFTLTTAVANEAAFVGDVYVPNGYGVPNSVVDRIFRVLSGKATIVISNQIDDNNIHFACDDSGFGWDSPAAGDAAAEMLVAIKTMGDALDGRIAIGDELSDDPPIPSKLQAGTVALELDVGGVTLTETTPFQLT